MKTNSKQSYKYPSQQLTKDNSNLAVTVTLSVIFLVALALDLCLNH